MKKTLLLVLIMSAFTWQNCFATGGDVVLAEKITENTFLQGSMKALDMVQIDLAKMADAKQKWITENQQALQAVDWIEDFRSVTQIYELLESIVCTMGQTSSLMQISGGMNSCHVNIKYQMTLINMQYSTDLLKKVFISSKLVTMSAEGRMSTLKDIIASLQEAINSFESINNDIKGDIIHNIQNEYMIKQISNSANYSLTR